MTFLSTEKIASLPWHDAELVSISIDRSVPGERDEFLLNIRWPDGVENSLVFSDCYAARLELNFGIIANESIRDVVVLSAGDMLSEVRHKWKGMGVAMDELFEFRLETNSTASTIAIVAKRCQMGSRV